MFSHPVSKTGYFFIVIAVLVFWFQPGNTFDSRLGFGLFAYALAGIGPFLILLGVIAEGFLRLDKTMRDVASTNRRSDERTDKFRPLGPLT